MQKPNRRPIPQVDTKAYAEAGELFFKPWAGTVAIEMHFCTSFLNQGEALAVSLSLFKACKEEWGDQFTREFLSQLEKL